MLSGSKETAFIYAVMSAGVAHVVTLACSAGNLTDCSCDPTHGDGVTPEGWKWGGCRCVPKPRLLCVLHLLWDIIA